MICARDDSVGPNNNVAKTARPATMPLTRVPDVGIDGFIVLLVLGLPSRPAHTSVDTH